LTLAIVLVKRRDFTLFAFDPTHAHAIGLNPRRLEALLLGLLALTVVIALQAVGIVLVVAMLIIPGATAYLLTDRFETMLVVAAGVSIGSSVLGTYLSFHADLSTGGTIVVSQAVLFTLAYLFSPSQGILGRRRLRARRRISAGVGARDSRQDIEALP